MRTGISAKSGFTLVELSIVLVILGLLVGGVLTGQSLIRAAEIRNVVTEASSYQTAIYTFRDKYFAAPGDMSNATSFWGVLAGTGSDAACQTTAATGKPTCNGNGNAILDDAASASDEKRRFWQHLANAELIQGQYNGIYNAGVKTPANSPTSKNPKGTWAPLIENTVTLTGLTVRFPLPAGTTLAHSGWAGTSGVADSNSLRPEDTWNIDTKIDDGKPGTGNLLAAKGNGVQTFCTDVAGTNNTATDTTAVYVLSNKSRDCDFLLTWK